MIGFRTFRIGAGPGKKKYYHYSDCSLNWGGPEKELSELCVLPLFLAQPSDVLTQIFFLSRWRFSWILLAGCFLHVWLHDTSTYFCRLDGQKKQDYAYHQV